METPDVAKQDPPEGQGAALLLALKSVETRVTKLEQVRERGSLKKVTENAGAIALFLGLVLTLASLRDVFVSKPEADRISKISQFNRAVNSAAQIRQELVQFQMQANEPALKLALASAALPRILNDVATARAILRDMKDSDVGIPQLTILISESFSTGDFPSARDFVMRAVSKTDESPYLRAEAKRYQAKYLYATGSASEGRQAYRDSLALIGESPLAAPARAYNVADWIILEFAMGDCTAATTLLNQWTPDLRSSLISPATRQQLAASVVVQLEQLRGRCPIPENLNSLLAR